MKKLVLLIVLMAVPAISFAKLDIGAKIGYNASKFSTDFDQISSDFKSGFQIGAFGRIGDSFFLQPELLYSIYGSKLNYNSSSYNVDQNSIDIGLLLGLSIINGDIISINLQAGPFASILTSKGLFQVPGEITNSEFEDFNWGVKFGAGLDLSNLTLELRYLLGMSDVYKTGSGFQEIDMKNSKIEVAVGIKLLSF